MTSVKKMLSEGGKNAYYNKRCRCVMIDVVSHVDGRCLGSLEINDRLPLCARSLSFALSFSGREISIFFFFLQPPYGIFFFLLFLFSWFSHFLKERPNRR